MTGNSAGGLALLEKAGFIDDQNRILVCEMLDHIIADNVTQLIGIPAAAAENSLLAPRAGIARASARIQPVLRRSLPSKPSRNNPAETATRSCVNNGLIWALTSRSEDAQSSSVVSIDAPVTQSPRIILAYGLECRSKCNCNANLTTSGSIVTGTGGTIDLTGTDSITGGTATGTGLLKIDGTVSVSGPFGVASSFAQSSGRLGGAGTLTVTGAAALTGGTETGSGTTLLQGGVTLGAAGSSNAVFFDGGRTLELAGAATVAGTNDGLYLSDSTGTATLKIDSGATLNDQTTSVGLTIGNNGGAGGSVTNAGTFQKTGSAATSTVATAFNNTGTVDVESGTLAFSGLVNNTGSLQANGGDIKISNAVSDGGSALISGSGQIEYSAASNENITFGSGATGELVLDHAESFSGTVAGLAAASSTSFNAIDLTDFKFADTSITGVAGTGAQGTTTNVTLKDSSDGLTATIHLLNQFAGQFATTASAYTLASAQPASPTAGTLLTVVPSHG